MTAEKWATDDESVASIEKGDESIGEGHFEGRARCR